MWDPTTNRVHVTRDIIWLRRMFFGRPTELGEDEAIQPIIALLRAEVGEREENSSSDEESKTSDESSASTDQESESEEEEEDDAEQESLDAEEERDSTVNQQNQHC